MKGKTISVRVTPKSGRNEVKQETGRLRVRVSAAPEDGKANKAVRELLAEHFNIKVSEIKIVSGEKSRDKVFEIGT